MRQKLIPILTACVLLAACKTGTDAQAGDPSGNIATPPVASAGPSIAAADPTPAHAVDRTVRSGGHAYPDQTLTPGATFAGVTAAQVCTSGWASAHRNVSDSIRHQAFATYGIPYSTHSRYELDHLIPLELGGDNTTRNLWPEPLTDDDSTGPNKDALENHLHALVCHHQLGLVTAQHAIATNWVQAWNRYEHQPVTGSAPSSRPRTTSPPRSAPKPPSHPSGATARCNDGTYSYAAHHQGACSHHGGVAVFYR